MVALLTFLTSPPTPPVPPARPVRALDAHALHGRGGLQHARICARDSSARGVHGFPQNRLRVVAALFTRRVPVSLRIVRHVQKRVEAARAGEVDAFRALGPRRLREVRVAITKHAIHFLPQHVEAPLRMCFLGTFAGEARARPINAGALTDATPARGLGPLAPRPRRPFRYCAAPRRKCAPELLAAAVAEEHLDNPVRAFILTQVI